MNPTCYRYTTLRFVGLLSLATGKPGHGGKRADLATNQDDAGIFE